MASSPRPAPSSAWASSTWPRGLGALVPWPTRRPNSAASMLNTKVEPSRSMGSNPAKPVVHAAGVAGVGDGEVETADAHQTEARARPCRQALALWVAAAKLGVVGVRRPSGVAPVEVRVVEQQVGAAGGEPVERTDVARPLRHRLRDQQNAESGERRAAAPGPRQALDRARGRHREQGHHGDHVAHTNLQRGTNGQISQRHHDQGGEQHCEVAWPRRAARHHAEPQQQQDHQWGLAAQRENEVLREPGADPVLEVGLAAVLGVRASGNRCRAPMVRATTTGLLWRRGHRLRLPEGLAERAGIGVAWVDLVDRALWRAQLVAAGLPQVAAM